MNQEVEEQVTIAEEKKQPGQSGIDGHRFRRTERIEVRFSPIERLTLQSLALAGGYKNLAQYLRETGLCGREGVTSKEKEKEQLQYLQIINRIGECVDSFSLQMAEGRQPDEEMLLLLMQIQDIAEHMWRAAQGNTGNHGTVI